MKSLNGTLKNLARWMNCFNRNENAKIFDCIFFYLSHSNYKHTKGERHEKKKAINCCMPSNKSWVRSIQKYQRMV